jgi:putative CocE/NonD family hydrolase
MKTKSKFIRAFLLLTAVILYLPLMLSGQTIEGDWYGKADVGGMVLRISIHVKADGDKFSSTWDSPDQGAFGIPSTTTTFKYPDFTFSHAGAGFKYSGIVDGDYKIITGVLEQAGRKFEIEFGRNPLNAPPNSPEALKERYDKQEVYITMRDGIKLFTSVYTPKNDSVPHPILLNRTPYDIEPGGPGNFNVFVQLYSRYTEGDYILAFQDVRGRYMSEGSFEDIRPIVPDRKSDKDIDESTDTWDTVDWLVKNIKNNNGKVGIFGISYPGFYSTMGLIKAHPAVKAVSPQAPVTAWFLGDDFHHNGAFFLLDCFSFYYSNGKAFHSQTRSGFPRFKWPVQDSYEFFLDLGAVKNIAPKYLGDSIKFWNDAFAHPDYDQFWKARDPRQYLRDVKPAVMTVGGWFDAEDLYGALHTYEAIEKQNPSTTVNCLVMGPWSHGQWAFGQGKNMGNIYWGLDANKKFGEIEKGFFDHYLKGEQTPPLAEATIFVTGSNEWRDFESWPPKNVASSNVYLLSGETASFDPPSDKTAFDEYVSDPLHPVPYTDGVHTERTAEYMDDDQRFASKRPDVATYETGVLSDDITLTGPLTADLFVSTTGTDADYIVKLIDVFPPDMKSPSSDEVKVPMGGYQMLVRGEIFRGKYRNSFEKPEPFIPGKITEVKYTLPDVAHTFKKGHRIMVQIQNSWFPLVDRNPQKFVDIYTCTDNDFHKETQRIYHDAAHPSHLSVTVLK